MSVVPATSPFRSDPLGGRGFTGTLFESARQSFVLLLQNRLLWLLLAAELLSGVIAFGIAGNDRNRLDGHDLFCLLAWWFQSWVVLPWATLYLSIQSIHTDIEDRTFQYPFLRPVGRAPLLLGKWLAAVSVSAGLVGVGAAALHLGVAARPDVWGDGVERESLAAFLLLSVFGAMAYAAFGTWFAATFRRPLVFGAVFVVLQMVTALMPVSAGVRAMTVSDPLRRLLIREIEPSPRLEQILWPGERVLREDAIGNPVVALVLLTSVLLALGLFSYCRAEYDSRTRE